MTRLDIRLLGEFAILYNDAPVTAINSQRLQCLLAYLLLHRDAPVARQRLAFLFWPDSVEAQARSNLRNLLHNLTQALPNGEPFIETDGQTVQWRAGAPYTLDVDLLLDALDKAQTADDLRKALELYRGPLLPSCYDDWIMPERERLEQKLGDVLQRFIDRFEKDGAYRDAITFAQHLVRRDPLREDLYRQIMRLCALSGDRAGIARTFKECREALKRELDVEPSQQTVEAYEKYRLFDPAARPASVGTPVPTVTADAAKGTVANAAPAPAVDSPTPAVPAIPAPSVGRTVMQLSSQAITDAAVRRAMLSSAAQQSTTEIPLALACVAGIYLLLLDQVVALPTMASVAWGLLAAASIAGVGSFVWRFVVNFDKAYANEFSRQQQAKQVDQQAALDQLRQRLAEGFKETRLPEGHYVLRDLDYEYQQCQAVIARHQEAGPLSLSYLPGLVDETYRRGLSVLEDTLDLAQATTSPKDQRLDAEIKDLEDKLRAAAGRSEEAARTILWQEKLAALRQRLEAIGKGRLRIEELLQQASRCETALNLTRVEVANLKADSWTISINAVLESLQKTIDQVKAVQDEMRRLGY